MRRRTASKSPKKLPKRSTSPKKCNNCLANKINEVHLSRSLYRKYSFSQNHIFLERVNHLQQTLSTKSLQNAATSVQEQKEEFLSRYHRSAGRKAVMLKVKELYKLHRDMPRMFLPGFANIISKCHHRKRLVEYFKLAKILGLRVDSLAYSSFMLSLHITRSCSKTYSRLLCQAQEVENEQEIQTQGKDVGEFEEKSTSLSMLLAG